MLKPDRESKFNAAGSIKLRLPPSPQTRSRDLVRDPLNFYLTLTREYGDVVCYRPAPEMAFLVNHPDYIRHILVDNNRNYTKETYSNQMFKTLVGDGLLTSEGETWRQQRRLMQPAFHHQRITLLDGLILRSTQAMLAKWKGFADQGRSVDIASEMASLTLTITTQALFGIDLGEEVDEVGIAVNMGGDLLEKPNHPRFRNALQIIKDIVDRIIEQRRGSQEHTHDLLSILLHTQDEETGVRMDDQQLRNQVITLLLAGYETTASALTWAWYLLSQHESVFQRMREEAIRVLGDRPVSASDLPDLIYTRYVFEEGMRLFPPAWMLGRRAIGDDALGGFSIPAGTIVAISPYTMHRHPQFWEQPDIFDPDRFSPARSAGRHRYAYIPFGGGPRQCIGNSFAMLEAQMILSTVSRAFYPRLEQGVAIHPQPIFILRPNRDMRMQLIPQV